jgi:hypothetical protein
VAGVIIAGGADTIEALYFDGQAIECTGCKNAVNGN